MAPVKPPLFNSPPTSSSLLLRDRILSLGTQTYLMGILNVTPDSFSDGGKYLKSEDAVSRLEALLESGADFIDVGGESTRPGALPVSAEEETRRILPVLEAWKEKKRNAFLSVDTSKSEVAEVALQYGASLVNDVTALKGDSRMASVVARYQAGLVLMHMKGTPRTMQHHPAYGDIVSEINCFFEEKIQEAVQAGVREDSLILDPGIGFGKSVTHNLEILQKLRDFRGLGRPLLVGVSRKSFIGQILGTPVEKRPSTLLRTVPREVEGRIFGTAASVAVSILNGADIVRVHDLSEMKDLSRVVDAIQKGYRE